MDLLHISAFSPSHTVMHLSESDLISLPAFCIKINLITKCLTTLPGKQHLFAVIRLFIYNGINIYG